MRQWLELLPGVVVLDVLISVSTALVVVVASWLLFRHRALVVRTVSVPKLG